MTLRIGPAKFSFRQDRKFYCQNRSGHHQAFYQVGTKGSFQWVSSRIMKQLSLTSSWTRWSPNYGRMAKRSSFGFVGATYIFFLVNDQLDAQFFFLICLYQFSTCFEQPRAHHQENQLYHYNIWYMSLCVGDRLVCRSRPCTTVQGTVVQGTTDLRLPHHGT
jgi:hypothetical protein